MTITRFLARKILLWFLVCSVAFIAGFGSGQLTKVSFGDEKPKFSISRELPGDKKTLDFSLFWEVWDRLHHDYFAKEKLNPEDLIYGAIRGMVGAVGDPYTEFLPPSRQKALFEDLSGSFEGVGIHIGFKGSQLAVIAPVEGSPADAAGVLAGDFIVHIKDEKRDITKGTVGINLQEAVEAIRGPSGTEVILTLTREGVDKPFEVKITRAKIDVSSVVISYIEKEGRKIPHLKLLNFGEETGKEWDRAVSDIFDTCPKDRCGGVVLDLRNNNGGFLNGSVFIASEFLKSGTVVIQERADGSKDKLTVGRVGKLLDVPVVVLVNKGSASASEIVAGALQDHKRAKLIGETTFGKGTIQESRELTGGAGLKITTARWLTPNGVWVNDKGLDPDIKVEDKVETEEDEQLERAIEELVK